MLTNANNRIRIRLLVAVDGKRRQNFGNHCQKFSNKESCNMASEIAIIKVPAPIVTLQQFAELEGVSERTAYRWTTGDNPCVPIEPRTIRKGCKKAGGPIRIYYARWKEEQLRKALGHSRFQLVIGA
ncbi:hypothetical protein M1720_09955 [Salmonella enterica subsp. enterica serovar Sandiego]|nr:hypothetical protein [Salmonella enterica subsp. enterica serovar Sandiego]